MAFIPNISVLKFAVPKIVMEGSINSYVEVSDRVVAVVSYWSTSVLRIPESVPEPPPGRYYLDSLLYASDLEDWSALKVLPVEDIDAFNESVIDACPVRRIINRNGLASVFEDVGLELLEFHACGVALEDLKRLGAHYHKERIDENEPICVAKDLIGFGDGMSFGFISVNSAQQGFIRRDLVKVLPGGNYDVYFTAHEKFKNIITANDSVIISTARHDGSKTDMWTRAVPEFLERMYDTIPDGALQLDWAKMLKLTRTSGAEHLILSGDRVFAYKDGRIEVSIKAPNHYEGRAMISAGIIKCIKDAIGKDKGVTLAVYKNHRVLSADWGDNSGAVFIFNPDPDKTLESWGVLESIKNY